jgi:hypothetical protein
MDTDNVTDEHGRYGKILSDELPLYPCVPVLNPCASAVETVVHYKPGFAARGGRGKWVRLFMVWVRLGMVWVRLGSVWVRFGFAFFGELDLEGAEAISFQLSAISFQLTAVQAALLIADS